MPTEEETDKALEGFFNERTSNHPSKDPLRRLLLERVDLLSYMFSDKARMAEEAHLRLWAHCQATQAGGKGFAKRAESLYGRVQLFPSELEEYEKYLDEKEWEELVNDFMLPRDRKKERLDGLQTEHLDLLLKEVGSWEYDPPERDPEQLLDHLLVLEWFYHYAAVRSVEPKRFRFPAVYNDFLLVSIYDISLMKALCAANQMCLEMRESIPKSGMREGKQGAKAQRLQAVIEEFYKSDFNLDEFTSFSALCDGLQERLGGKPSAWTIARYLLYEEKTEGIREILRKKMLI